MAQDGYLFPRPARNATWSAPSSSTARRLTNEAEDEQRVQLGLHPCVVPLEQPLVELIFVHGLREGPRSAWSAGTDPAAFWPEWFNEPSEDRHFDRVRIHTFGHSGDLVDRRGSSNSLDECGISLVKELTQNPFIKRDASNPLVFVAHSLGGQIVKKAFNYAKSYPTHEVVARRFHTILFLATPHRSADNLITLGNILRACSTTNMRSIPAELEAIGGAAEAINEDFLKNYHGLRLRSFYETLPFLNTDLPVLDGRHATMGLVEEEKTPLNANHANISKFESPSDPSFITLRDALISTFEEVLDELVAPERVKDEMRQLGEFLDVNDAEDDELANISDQQCPGTCAWLMQEPSFLEWRDPPRDISPADLDISSLARRLSLRRSQPRPPRFFWLTGAPGTGKSVLASSVIRNLQDRECSFFFSKQVEKSKQSLSGLLRSMAFQMARRNVALRRALLSMRQSQSAPTEFTDSRVVWKQLFLGKIFKQRQYWVIDALDECPGGYELIDLLVKIPIDTALSVFITSRRNPKLEERLSKYPIPTIHIDHRTTEVDIRTFLEQNADNLPANNPTELEDLIETLVTKSNGSFLWTSLVLQQLTKAWTDKSVKAALRSIPDGMTDLYINIFADLSKTNSGDREMVQTILRWVVCSRRPLTIEELVDAIRLDIKNTAIKLDKMIETVFGQILSLDSQRRVRLLHETIREFLLQQHSPAMYAIDKAAAHSRLADVCLNHLPSHGPRRHNREKCSEKFHEYATLFWSDHVLRSPRAASMGPTQQLAQFLESGILTWIESIARKGDLSYLTKTATNLRGYLGRRLDMQAPLSPLMKAVQDWAIDLIRLVTVFGRHLLKDPSSIHRVIPPLCPTHSIINSRFGKPANGLEVIGLSPKGWSDRISSATYDESSVTLACCKERHAVGLHSGKVVIYDADTCQEVLCLEHDEPVKIVQFAYAHHWIVFAGKRSIKVCDYDTGDVIRNIELSSEPLALVLAEDDSMIITACRNATVTWWGVDDGSAIYQSSWPSTGEEAVPRPRRVYISSELNVIILAPRNKPLVVFDLDKDFTRPRYLSVSTSADEEALAFNPDLKMIAVCFFTGELCTFGLHDLRLANQVEADAAALAISPDGATLVAGMKSGSIQVHDFESLNLLHVLPSREDDQISMLTFTPSGLRFMDVRVKEYNVWEPSALFRRRHNDDSTSEGQLSFSTTQSRLGRVETSEGPLITAMISHHTGDFVFCGMENGNVTVYELGNGAPAEILYTHDRNTVLFLDWNASKEILVSCDTSSQLQIHHITTATQARVSNNTRVSWHIERLDGRRLERSVQQVLISPDGEYVMISTAGIDDLWTLDGKHVHTHRCEHSIDSPLYSQKWTTHPTDRRQLIEIERSTIHLLEWGGQSNAKPTQRNLSVASGDRRDFKRGDFNVHFVRIWKDTYAVYDNNPLTRSLVWCSPSFSTSNAPANSNTDAQTAVLSRLSSIADQIVYIVGIYRWQLVFVDHDSWICSVRLDEEGLERDVARHFPIPHCWQSTVRRLLCLVTVKGDVVIARNEELAVVKRGLLG